MTTAIQGFLRASHVDQVVYLLAVAAVLYGLIWARRECNSSLVGLIVALGFIVLAAAAFCWVCAGGAL